MLQTLKPRQIQHLSEPSRTAYQAWVKQKRIKPDIELLNDDHGSALLWLRSRRTAKRIVLYLHGGGYLVPLSDATIEWAWNVFVEAGTEQGVETAVAILEYTLCPIAAFPVQLSQATAGLERILSSGVRPQDIICGGDSAGGNLTMQLLYHLLRPHPSVPVVTLVEPLGGVFMVSPWLSARTDDASFRENHGIDIISAAVMQTSIRAILGETADSLPKLAEDGAGAFPFDQHDVAFLEQLPSIADRLYVSAGQYEVMRDQITAFAREVQKAAPEMDVQLAVFNKHAHCFIFLEGLLRRPGEATYSMIEWLR